MDYYCESASHVGVVATEPRYLISMPLYLISGSEPLITYWGRCR